MISLFTFIVSFLVFLVLMMKHLRSPSPKPKFPPGPKRLPLIGNLHQLFECRRLPHRFLTEMAKKYGPIMQLQLGEVPLVVLSSPQVAETALKDHDRQFSQRPLNNSINTVSYGDTGLVFAPYETHWREMRKLFMAELLSPKCVQSFRSMRVNEVWSLVESIKLSCSSQTNPIINFSQEILKLDARLTCNAAFGFSCKEIDDAMDLLQEATGCALCLQDIFPTWKPLLDVITGVKTRFRKLHTRLDKILEDVIKQHKIRKAERMMKENHEEYLLDVLLKHEKSSEHHISMTHVKSIIWEIIGAGTETLASTIDWAMAEMIRNPEIMKKAQEEARRVLIGKDKTNVEEYIQDLTYIKLVIKETLRLHPPTPLAPRELINNCEINGFEILEKSRILFNIYAINRDPK